MNAQPPILFDHLTQNTTLIKTSWRIKTSQLNSAHRETFPNFLRYRMTASKKVYDVIVVGAGLSGLQAAVAIRAAGFTVCVLEATNRVGGKTLTVKSSEKGYNDLGAAWINDTNQSEMFKLFQKYGLETEVQRASGDTIIHLADGSLDKVPYGQLSVRIPNPD